MFIFDVHDTIHFFFELLKRQYLVCVYPFDHCTEGSMFISSKSSCSIISIMTIDDNKNKTITVKMTVKMKKVNNDDN